MARTCPDLLGSMQGQIRQLYDVDVEQDVRDYLVTDRAVLASLTDPAPGRVAEEQLIVVEGGDNVDVALYLDQGVLDRLVASDPRESISHANLSDFWTVLEGVSHFHYLAWNAGFDKPVTLLELEMQAEVDKYVSTRMLLLEQPEATLGAPLLQKLFAETTLHPELEPEEADRYQAASSLAARYCASLEGRFPASTFTRELLRELRTFYRLPQAAKIGRIREFR